MLSHSRKEMGVEAFLLLQLIFGYVVSCVSFLFGYSLQPWHLWVSLMFSIASACVCSKKLGGWIVALNIAVFALTLYTFTYVHIDASICHSPVVDFIAGGWNPIRENSHEAVRALFAAHSVPDVREFSVMHVLVVPKFVHILAAQLKSALGLYTASAYPMWVMFFALASASYRFSRKIWNGTSLCACAFAALMCCNPIILEHCFSGLVDYVSYASVAIALLSLVLWDRFSRTVDLFVFFAALSAAVVCKFSVLAPSLLLLGAMLCHSRGDKRVRIVAGVSLVVFLFMCLIPYWTSAWWHGSPFYPSHSFRDGVKLMDLTSDFIGNEDAMRMGYFARFVYAWVSRPLALWGCRLWYGCEEFAPLWRWDFLAAGCKWQYCALIWGAFSSALFFARNRVSYFALVLFASFFAVTTKYIGYPRYVAHIFAASALLWFNVAYSQQKRALRIILLCMCAGASVFFASDAIVKFLQQVRDESLRQQNLKIMAQSGKRTVDVKSPLWWTYALRSRLSLNSLSLSETEQYSGVDIYWPLMFDANGLLKRDDVSFGQTLINLPHPLWDTVDSTSKELLK